MATVLLQEPRLAVLNSAWAVERIVASSAMLLPLSLATQLWPAPDKPRHLPHLDIKVPQQTTITFLLHYQPPPFFHSLSLPLPLSTHSLSFSPPLSLPISMPCRTTPVLCWPVPSTPPPLCTEPTTAVAQLQTQCVPSQRGEGRSVQSLINQ